MDWEVGIDFDTSWAKSKAISQVEQALVCVTKRSTKKATAVLSDLVSKLTLSPDFHENDILMENWRTTNAAMASMFQHASTCIQGLKGDGRRGGNHNNQIAFLLVLLLYFCHRKRKYHYGKHAKFLESIIIQSMSRWGRQIG